MTTLWRHATFVLLLTSCITLRAQPKEEIGIYLSGALNLHNASFKRLGTIRSCCPEFTNTSGFGTSAGVFYTYPFNDTWRIQGRLTYADRSATFTDTEQSFVADLRDSAKVIEALFTHEIVASITDIGFEPLLLFRPLGGLDVMLGARIAIPIVSTFRQTETLTEPADYGSYLGAGRVYVDTSADIPSFVSTQMSVVLGLRYYIPLRTRGVTFFAPEFQYSIPLTRISDGTPWTVAHVRFGVAVGFTSPPRPSSPTPTDTTTVTPTATQPLAPPNVLVAPSASIVVKGVTADRREVEDVKIRIEEIAATEIVPVLPHVYFDSASTNWIPSQLASLVTFERNPEKMDLETAIHSIPWLIAKRLSERPSESARLIGATSDNGSDKGLTLARARAQSVKDAFVKRGVNASQITVEARRFPAKPTVASDTTQAPLAAAENRRVEIEVSDPSLLAPFSFPSIERAVDPPTMRAYLQTDNIDSISRWFVTVRQGATSLASFRGTTVLPQYVEWNFADSGTPGTEVPIEVRLLIDGAQRLEASDTVSVSQLTIRKKRVERIAGRVIERFNLLLFDFNDSRVGKENARLISEVRAKITPQTEVNVYGLTDELGAAEYNHDLSARRANEVAAILNVPQTRVVGSGEESPKYKSNSPVARGYNRTVVIELVTPVP